MEKPRLLIVEDDLDLSEMLSTFFTVQDYEVQTAAWGSDALRMSQQIPPDIVMLDIRLPDISGYDVCRQLRQQRRTQDVPIIFLTEKRDRVDKLTGLELGVVDYITKPFDIQELRLRVRNVLKRAAQQTMINTITELPDVPLSEQKMAQAVTGGGDWAMLLLSVEGLDKLREQFGFVAADEMLRAVALMTRTATREVAGDNDDLYFIGHFAPTSFVVIVTRAALPIVRERTESRIRYSLSTFYRPAVWGEDGIPNTLDDMLKMKTGVITAADVQTQGESPLDDVNDLRARLLASLQDPLQIEARRATGELRETRA